MVPTYPSHRRDGTATRKPVFGANERISLCWIEEEDHIYSPFIIAELGHSKWNPPKVRRPARTISANCLSPKRYASKVQRSKTVNRSTITSHDVCFFPLFDYPPLFMRHQTADLVELSNS